MATILWPGALRIIALGKKNFLLAGSTDLAQNLAILRSIVSTCQLHGVDPYEYIKDMLVRLRDHDPDDLDQLMRVELGPSPRSGPHLRAADAWTGAGP